ncbi:hemopexin repeat-containing protein [Streptomyces finlayi]|uniref:Uncharacterized protein n=1 Tax=Streptomyces finlayi TaxID=67296 RepID=A0A7G7BGM1_9ACTN|nr:hemopexin repeat-containing protein [Streptomyces finlayi]QNE74486.1 hypothetical protein F0344_07565 [Streptomyces finlayi]
MSELETTAEERLARVRATLSGTSTSRRAAHRQKGSRAQNLLGGVMLRAAERQEAGRELTELEGRLLGVLRAAVPQEEVAAFGRAWREATGKNTVDWLPATFTARSADTGYAMADLVADLAAAGPEILAQPNVHVVNVADLTAEGGSLDSEEFLAALAEYGSGATVVTGPELPSGKDVAPLRANLALDLFHCIRSTGDTFFGPDDEIYWVAASGADDHSTKTYSSPEFGSLEDNTWKSFDANATIFSGTVHQTLITDIECWERDGGDIWKDLREGLADVAETCAEACADIQEHGESQEASLAAVVAIVSALLGLLLELFTNDDDLIQDRSLAFTRPALTELALRPDARDYWNFSGSNGHYRLYIRCHLPETALVMKSIEEGWPGLVGTSFTGGIDAAVKKPGHPSDVYLFRGAEYLRYDAHGEKIVIGPKSLATGWPGLAGTAFAQGIDAATQIPGYSVQQPQPSPDLYLFRGNQYVRYVTATEKITVGPKPIATGWPGLADTAFADKIDAAAPVPGGAPHLYLFTGDQYVRYDTTQEKIVAGPKPIAEGWPGLAGSDYAGGIHAACSVPDGSSERPYHYTDIYLFLGQDYTRYSII